METQEITQPPVSRLIWVIYNTLGMRAPHPKPLTKEANQFCRLLQTPYWQAYRKRKFGS